MAGLDINKLKNPGAALWSVSLYLYTKVEDLRNGDENMGTLEMIGRRIVGELAYAGIAVAAAVEAVFRVAIGLIAVPFTCFLPGDDGLFAGIAVLGIMGAVFSVEAEVLTLVSLVTNVYQKEMTTQSVYKQVIPECIDEMSAEIFKY